MKRIVLNCIFGLIGLACLFSTFMFFIANSDFYRELYTSFEFINYFKTSGVYLVFLAIFIFTIFFISIVGLIFNNRTMFKTYTANNSKTFKLAMNALFGLVSVTSLIFQIIFYSIEINHTQFVCTVFLSTFLTMILLLSLISLAYINREELFNK